jgi:UDP-N-acetylmuramoylalanine-D-glutamate ligase
MMKELYAMRISPHVAIFTTVPTNNSYEKIPFEILAFQTYNNYLIATDEVIDATRNFNDLPRAKMLRTKPSIIPAEWGFRGKGTHDVLNAALALQAARLFKVEDEAARHALSKWKPLKGRLELVKKVKNVEFYNDAASVNPISTGTAVESLSSGEPGKQTGEQHDKNVVLLFGGAAGSSDYRSLYPLLSEYVHTLVLLPGSGTMRERVALGKIDHTEVFSASSVEEAARLALEHARKGDKVLFSPGFDVGGFDSSRKERSERFVRAVRGL